jgi:hypothetical protein
MRQEAEGTDITGCPSMYFLGKLLHLRHVPCVEQEQGVVNVVRIREPKHR